MWELLVRDLESESLAKRREAAQGLLRLGSQAAPAAVPLVRACQEEDEGLRELVSGALEDLGPPPLSSLPDLRQLCAAPHLDVAYWAVTLVGRLGADAGQATPELIACLSPDRPRSVRQRAAWALGRVGPAAAGAESALRAVLGEADPRLVRLAGEALQRMQTSA
jgi:HEAT repeat protein